MMKVNRQIHSDIASSNFSSDFILDYKKIDIPNLINLYLYACQYDIDFYDANLFNQLNIARPKNISQAVNKRQAEYLAGRYSASLALKHFGITDFDILTGRHRCPVWPQNVLGSITHTNSKAYAVAAYCTDYNYNPYVGQYIDFSTASMINIFDKDQSFELELNQSLNNRLIKGSRFKGWFSVESSHVLTLIAL